MLRSTFELADFLVAAPAPADSANLHTFHCLHDCRLALQLS